jgi:hypothetical protein
MRQDRRTRLGILFGGRSGEHEVSLTSAASVIAALDPGDYEIFAAGITPSGRIARPSELKRMLPAELLGRIRPLAAIGTEASVLRVASGAPEAPPVAAGGDGGPEIWFPQLHGPYGEDGTMLDLAEKDSRVRPPISEVRAGRGFRPRLWTEAANASPAVRLAVTLAMDLVYLSARTETAFSGTGRRTSASVLRTQFFPIPTTRFSSVEGHKVPGRDGIRETPCVTSAPQCTAGILDRKRGGSTEGAECPVLMATRTRARCE